MSVNQAVVFTKPVHHLSMDLTPDALNQAVLEYLGSRDFTVAYSCRVTGPELAEREIIRKHYLMYSKASYGDLGITEAGRTAFADTFGKDWDKEMAAGRILGNPALLSQKEIGVHELFALWNNAEVRKIQGGLLVAWLESLDCYCINAFYPAMEANFYDAKTVIDYHVVEFDATKTSWARFRKNVLGATNAAKADPESFRGRLYAEYRVDFPGCDNFVHGSAGPFEGLVERDIHESSFVWITNPVAKYLASLGVELGRFREWKSYQTIAQLGALFDETEEKNTDEVYPILDKVAW